MTLRTAREAFPDNFAPPRVPSEADTPVNEVVAMPVVVIALGAVVPEFTS